MKINIKITEGAMNFPQSTAPIGRQSVDSEDNDNEKLADPAAKRDDETKGEVKNKKNKKK